jgi:carbamoyl-phosphate synthase large subunit
MPGSPGIILRGGLGTTSLGTGTIAVRATHARPQTCLDPKGRGPRHMNVLITAAGRRTSLVRGFVEAAHQRGGLVHAGDVDGLAPALYLADNAVRIRHTDDPAYVDDLLDVVERHGIGLIIPTIDAELLILARNQDAFAARDCHIAVSAPSFVEVTLDKHQTGATFGGAGIHVPWSWLPPIDDDAGLPTRVFAKPRRGSASQDQYLVAREELAGVLPLVVDPIVQEVLRGAEITIDALLDLEGRPIHFVPRFRIRTLGGESVQGVTLDHDDRVEGWIERVLRLCSRLGAAGPLTIQAFDTAKGLVLSEINPRFGGGYPLAEAAGGTYARWLLDMVEGKEIQPRLRAYESGVYMTRYYVEHFTRKPAW